MISINQEISLILRSLGICLPRRISHFTQCNCISIAGMIVDRHCMRAHGSIRHPDIKLQLWSNRVAYLMSKEIAFHRHRWAMILLITATAKENWNMMKFARCGAEKVEAADNRAASISFNVCCRFLFALLIVCVMSLKPALRQLSKLSIYIYLIIEIYSKAVYDSDLITV